MSNFYKVFTCLLFMSILSACGGSSGDTNNQSDAEIAAEIAETAAEDANLARDTAEAAALEVATTDSIDIARVFMLRAETASLNAANDAIEASEAATDADLAADLNLATDTSAVQVAQDAVTEASRASIAADTAFSDARDSFLTRFGSSDFTGGFGLDSNVEPWENFDLSDWALDAPNADPDDGLSARTTDEDFANGDLFDGSEEFFFTDASDGSMVFKSIIGGAKTSSNTSFPRSELREMLRAGDTSISTQGVTENNWALGYQPINDDIGARNGVLTATLSVEQVTTTGDSGQVGRVIIGQIHADNDEPLRLYYRKLPDNTRGGIYAVHEIRDDDDLPHFNILGSSSSSASDPDDGLELGEIFSYEIIAEGAEIEVVIRSGDNDGEILGTTVINMEDENSGYDLEEEWMYFKAGAYTQNNSGDEDDFDLVKFYRLNNTH